MSDLLVQVTETVKGILFNGSLTNSRNATEQQPVKTLRLHCLGSSNTIGPSKHRSDKYCKCCTLNIHFIFLNFFKKSSNS